MADCEFNMWMVAKTSMYNRPRNIVTGAEISGTVSSRIFGSEDAF